MSVPHPSAAPSIASSAASPPLVPPDEYDLLYGLRVQPHTGFTHSKKKMSWGTLVLQMGMPPAARTRATT